MTLESNWLEYCRSVLTDQDHIAACSLAGGSPEGPGVDATDLRWPGYFGREYKANQSVLVVSNVHRNFASHHVTVVQRDLLVNTTRLWRDRQVSDAHYLAGVRSVYEAGLSGGWKVSVHLRKTLSEMGLDVTEIAYVNAARCQYPEGQETTDASKSVDRKRKKGLQKDCLKRFPIRDLEVMLRPRVVLYMSLTAYTEAESSAPEDAVMRVCFNQLNGNLSRTASWKGQTLAMPMQRAEWTKELIRWSEATKPQRE